VCSPCSTCIPVLMTLSLMLLWLSHPPLPVVLTRCRPRRSSAPVLPHSSQGQTLTLSTGVAAPSSSATVADISEAVSPFSNNNNNVYEHTPLKQRGAQLRSATLYSAHVLYPPLTPTRHSTLHYLQPSALHYHHPPPFPSSPSHHPLPLPSQ
jgi:hypothetical protein